MDDVLGSRANNHDQLICSLQEHLHGNKHGYEYSIANWMNKIKTISTVLSFPVI